MLNATNQLVQNSVCAGALKVLGQQASLDAHVTRQLQAPLGRVVLQFDLYR